MKLLAILTLLILILTYLNIPEKGKKVEVGWLAELEVVYEYKYPMFPKGREEDNL